MCSTYVYHILLSTKACPLDNIEFELVDEEDQDLLEKVYMEGDLECENYYMRKKDFNKEKWWLGWSSGCH